MARLIPCPSCHSHVMSDDRECPHCGTALRTTTALRAPVVLLGLALTGCPPIEAAYGVPDSGEPPTTGANTTGGTDTETGTGTGSGGQTTTAGSGSGSSTGMADTGTTMATDGTAGSGTAGSGTVGEPEYGVAESGSTSIGEPEYGVPETTTN